MIGLFGCVSHVPGRAIARMRAAPGHYLCSGYSDPHAFITAGVVHEGVVVAFAGSLRNRRELRAALGLKSDAPDSDIVTRAYTKWGENCCAQLHGDWSFVAWHAEQRKLFLARDHFGNTALYYHHADDTFAFSTSRRALLQLGLAPVELDELYLAQVLTSWTDYHGERTIHMPIKRLPPAHHLTLTSEREEVKCYWRLEDTTELRLPTRQAYAEALREVLGRAVTESLDGHDRIATTLSGGLDSGSVTALAGRALRSEGRTLDAYVSVPVAETRPFTANGFGDEWPLANTTAAATGNVALHRIDAADVSPIAAIRTVLNILLEPTHSAVSLYWLYELNRVAAEQGNTVLLTGQMGNMGISWRGYAASQSIAWQIRQNGIAPWLKDCVRWSMGPAMRRRRSYRLDTAPWKRSAIAPDFAEDLRLRERRAADPMEAPFATPRAEQIGTLKPGRSMVGSIHAEMGAATGISVIDPTADARVLEYCLSVPDRIFIDPETGMDRWLVREAMKDLLPAPVRLNRTLGRQSSDIAPRLRIRAAEVEDALDECARGPANAYLDLANMRRVWDIVRTEDTPPAYILATTVLMRGIMAGLFVNGFGKNW